VRRDVGCFFLGGSAEEKPTRAAASPEARVHNRDSRAAVASKNENSDPRIPPPPFDRHLPAYAAMKSMLPEARLMAGCGLGDWDWGERGGAENLVGSREKRGARLVFFSFVVVVADRRAPRARRGSERPVRVRDGGVVWAIGRSCGMWNVEGEAEGRERRFFSRWRRRRERASAVARRSRVGVFRRPTRAKAAADPRPLVLSSSPPLAIDSRTL
jgi:hypothetical protein